jgi:PleD family two-component response regulator
VAEKLRSGVFQMAPLTGGMATEPTALTLSVGAASLAPNVVDAQLLMTCADRALYHAKRNGRNQVQIWTDAMA